MAESPTPPGGVDQDVTSRTALAVIWRSVGRKVAVALAAVVLFVGSFAAFGVILSKPAYNLGRRTGEVEGAVSYGEKEWEEKAGGVASVWDLCGVNPDQAGGPGWYVCSFKVVPIDTQPWSAESRRAPKVLVPCFSVRSKAITGRWYTPLSGGGLAHVDR
jgi:hypothetical protein